MTAIRFALIVSAFYVFTIGYEVGYMHGNHDGRGLIECKDGNLTIRNITVISVNEGFHIGPNACSTGAAITAGQP